MNWNYDIYSIAISVKTTDFIKFQLAVKFMLKTIRMLQHDFRQTNPAL